MSGTDRRTALQLAIAAAIAPSIGATSAAATVPERLIAPPSGTMRYVRTVSREIGEGLHFAVTRQFTVSFQQFAGGFMMHGTQVAVSADAPAHLARFAALEEARDESGLFPLALDPFGRILSDEIARPLGDDVRLAVEEALSTISQQPIPQDERTQVSQLVVALQAAGSRVMAHLPTDLFAPAAAPRREEQRIALPGGTEGRVETVFEGQCDGTTGLMRAAAREVVTVVADSSKRTHEEWSLTTI